ncbi:MAG: hypothetical protein J5911_01875 [Clostridia bacterium]|nr:hypothetical protein [Clostridia bacterium]
MLIYKIADVVFGLKPLYKYTPHLCENYLYTGDLEPEFSIVTTEDDIAYERSLSGAEKFPDYYLESLAVFRKLCDFVLGFRQGIIFHSSAVAVDGKAYLFTAPSGTGKSTHARLWREMLGDKVVMINDDKPIIRYIDGGFFVYGTPWNGKHHLDTNARAEIAAICEIRQGKENTISKISSKEMLAVVFNQTLRPKELVKMDNLLSILDKLLTSVPLYRLECDISREAAELSYGTMTGKEIK